MSSNTTRMAMFGVWVMAALALLLSGQVTAFAPTLSSTTPRLWQTTTTTTLRHSNKKEGNHPHFWHDDFSCTQSNAPSSLCSSRKSPLFAASRRNVSVLRPRALMKHFWQRCMVLWTVLHQKWKRSVPSRLKTEVFL